MLATATAHHTNLFSRFAINTAGSERDVPQNAFLLLHQLSLSSNE